MKKKTKLVCCLFALQLFFNLFFANSVFAYGVQTHEALTQEIAKFYNKNFPDNQFSEADIKLLMYGARREDDAPRWMNHFYDPVNNSGLHFLGSTWDSSKDWAQNESAQLSIEYNPILMSTLVNVLAITNPDALTQSDYAWRRAIKDYLGGNKERGLTALGHILHLLEDATVPAHTRDDPHPDVKIASYDFGNPDSYEKWTHRFVPGVDLGVSEILENKKPILLDSLNKYFDEIATYSNEHFYSNDTIGLGFYSLPVPIPEEAIIENGYRYNRAKDENGFYLLSAQKANSSILIQIISEITLTPQDRDTILNSYWSRLAPKAVEYGAGAIHLFFEEVEKNKNNPEFTAKPKTIFAAVVDGVKNFLALVAPSGPSNQQSIPPEISANEETKINSQTSPIQQENSTIKSEFQNQPESAEQKSEIAKNQPSETAPTLQTSMAQSNTQIPSAAENNSSETGNSKNSKTENQNASEPQPVFSGGGNSSGGGGVSAVVPATANQSSNSSDSTSQSSSSNSTSTSSNATSSSSNATSSSSNASSSSSTASSTSSSTVGNASHIVISEILFNASGTDIGKEFVELYNPATSSKDLVGWSLKYQEQSSSSAISLASFKTSSHPEDKTTIPAQGFLLIGLNSYNAANYNNKSADILRTGVLPNGNIKINLILYDDGGSEIDKISYSSSSITTAGDSLERKAFFSGGCVSSQNAGEFLGNSCDTDAVGDFEIRTTSNPQNSGSLPEPRSAPAANNFQVVYNFAPRIEFSWLPSQDALGSTSTNTYFLYDTSNPSSSLLLQASSTTSSTLSINEVGRNYNFEFKIQDRDGLSSSATSTIAAKSFLDNFYFYIDPRATSTYLFDLTTTSSRPFWNLSNSGPGQNYKAIVFYLNKDAPKQGLISSSDSFIANDLNFIRVKYEPCAAGTELIEQELIFPFNSNSSSCGPGQPFSTAAYLIGNLEDRRLVVKVASTTSQISFLPTDYIALAFYDFGGGWGGSQYLQLAAIDKTKYYFQNSVPAQNSPTTPANFTVSFDDFHSRLNLSWSSSTDADTLDRLITYQINYSTSTGSGQATSSVLSNSNWQSVGTALSTSIPAVYPNSYTIGLRAVDDFGNVSSSTIQNWSFPADFTPLPFQSIHDASIGSANGAGQKVLINATATINAVALWVEGSTGNFNHSDSRLEIRSDNNGSIGDLIASSTAKSLNQYDAPQELIYTFSSPVLLNASSSYWLVLVQVSNSNGSGIYGSASNPYPDGYWSSSPGSDAYFYLRRAP